MAPKTELKKVGNVGSAVGEQKIGRWRKKFTDWYGRLPVAAMPDLLERNADAVARELGRGRRGSQ